jgi:hypothetical protein
MIENATISGVSLKNLRLQVEKPPTKVSGSIGELQVGELLGPELVEGKLVAIIVRRNSMSG